MDISTLYNKTSQLWDLAIQCREELEAELCHKRLRHKESGIVGDFYDVDFTYIDYPKVRIIIMDHMGGKYRGSISDFEVLSE